MCVLHISVEQLQFDLELYLFIFYSIFALASREAFEGESFHVVLVEYFIDILKIDGFHWSP